MAEGIAHTDGKLAQGAKPTIGLDMFYNMYKVDPVKDTAAQAMEKFSADPHNTLGTQVLAKLERAVSAVSAVQPGKMQTGEDGRREEQPYTAKDLLKDSALIQENLISQRGVTALNPSSSVEVNAAALRVKSALAQFRVIRVIKEELENLQRIYPKAELDVLLSTLGSLIPSRFGSRFVPFELSGLLHDKLITEIPENAFMMLPRLLQSDYPENFRLAILTHHETAIWDISLAQMGQMLPDALTDPAKNNYLRLGIAEALKVLDEIHQNDRSISERQIRKNEARKLVLEKWRGDLEGKGTSS